MYEWNMEEKNHADMMKEMMARMESMEKRMGEMEKKMMPKKDINAMDDKEFSEYQDKSMMKGEMI
mgnify:CR=1 FL=1